METINSNSPPSEYPERPIAHLPIDDPAAFASSLNVDKGLSSQPISSPHFQLLRRPVSLSLLRARITAAYRLSEAACLPVLLDLARSTRSQVDATRILAKKLVNAVRYSSVKRDRGLKVQSLLQTFSLATKEGMALMCLAEALLRIPDYETRYALIGDKIGQGEWRRYLGKSSSFLVNLVAFGLLTINQLMRVIAWCTHWRIDDSRHTKNVLVTMLRFIAKGGKLIVCKSIELGVHLMGGQFVAGKTIAAALAHAKRYEDIGFCYSYDMLGEASMTQADAQRYYASYEQAIHHIGRASAQRGIYAGPGISIKLSALHPRYSFAQYDRVMNELYPRLKTLALLARRYDIGFNIDAEESERLDISLDLLEALCFESQLTGWHGIGFVVQAYQKRAPCVLDYLLDLARRSQHRLMIRLVKGAYWDSEIKRAQQDGLADYPVYTRKIYTDVSYLACAKKLLAEPEAFFPQFATHNAHTVAAIVHMAGANFYPGQYEFQCLHGMGEGLYQEIARSFSAEDYRASSATVATPSGVDASKIEGDDDTRYQSLNDGGIPKRPCRIYAPVGTHETLLAYLVRRLLENGANSSFVNRLANPEIAIDRLIADPVAAVEAMGAQSLSSHPHIPLPLDLYGQPERGGRRNAAGLDFTDEQCLSRLSGALLQSANRAWVAQPMCAVSKPPSTPAQAVLNPADRRDIVGMMHEATLTDVTSALEQAWNIAPKWASTLAPNRAAMLESAAEMMEAQRADLIFLLVREAGKTLLDAVGEVREAVDFLRYYAWQLRQAHQQKELSTAHTPSKSGTDDFSTTSLGRQSLGPVVCISPWNFPLAIFVGQISAALAAGNPVLAKPAEQTPLIAAQAVRIFHDAGIPLAALQLLPGSGETIGSALVADHRIRAVMFTGSTAVAKILQRQLAGRLDEHGMPLTLIAETGGQNAMIVDSSAQPEQVVADVLLSAFGSSGQRCSALRVLCLQEEIADPILAMLKGAMDELCIGNPAYLPTDMGPLIDKQACEHINTHIAALRACHPVYQVTLPEIAEHGSFVPPTLIELNHLGELRQEIFGPVLHVIRYQNSDDGYAALAEAIYQTGYALTMGIHTRIDQLVLRALGDTQGGRYAGNLYINRSMIGAVVGVQPFGGKRLSGTGPKAGGPLLLSSLCPGNALYLTSAALSAPAALPSSAVTDTFKMIAAPDGTIDTSRLTFFCRWLRTQGHVDLADMGESWQKQPIQCGRQWLLSGPTGEQNIYILNGRGTALCLADTEKDLLLHTLLALNTGNCPVWLDTPSNRTLYAQIVAADSIVVTWMRESLDWSAMTEPDLPNVVLFSGTQDALSSLCKDVSQGAGPLVSVLPCSYGMLNKCDEPEMLWGQWMLRLVHESVISVNTTATGGNTSLMVSQSE